MVTSLVGKQESRQSIADKTRGDMKKTKVQRIKDIVNRRSETIEIEGLREFVNYLQAMSHKDRIVFGFNVIFNRVRIR